MDAKIYIFSLDYGKRSDEKLFIKEILRNFDKDTVVGCGIFVNNNPYALELLLYVSIEKDVARFEEFLMQNIVIKNVYLTISWMILSRHLCRGDIIQ